MARARSSTFRVMGAVALLAAVAGVYAASTRDREPVGPPCRVTIGTESVSFTAPQAHNATTIAAVAKKLGMPNHAVTVAYATALQESKLYNLDYGDLDSVGIFQQRPSQGWGTREQIMTPRYSAAAFFTHLARLPNWHDMSTNDAAQAVQRSAFPDAYGQWETQARVAARSLTGEEPATFSCRAKIEKDAVLSDRFEAELRSDIAEPTIDVAVGEGRGWTIASWLVAHAELYNVRVVTFNGQRWSAESDSWEPIAPAELVVRVS